MFTTPLRVPGFKTLAAAYSINELGNWLGDIALAILVYDHTKSALATALLFVGTRFVPAFAAPLVVARTERFRPRVSLPLLYGLDAVVFAVLAIMVAGRFALAPVVLLGAVDGSLALAARAVTRSTSAALLTPHGLLRRGNALFNFGFTTAGALGPAIAGVVTAKAGPSTALAADAASFAVVAMLIAITRELPAGQPDSGVGWAGRLREALAYVRSRRLLMGLLTAQAAALFFFCAVIPIEVVYAKHTLGAGSSGYGWLLASWGVGMLAGGVVFASARRARVHYVLAGGTLLIGVAYLGLAAAPSIAVAAVVSAVGGLGNGVQWVSVVNIVQEATPAAMQARVLAVVEAIGALLPGIGFFAGGALATAGSPRTTYVVAGAGALLTLLMGAVWLRGLEWPERSIPAEDSVGAGAVAGHGPQN